MMKIVRDFCKKQVLHLNYWRIHTLFFKFPDLLNYSPIPKDQLKLPVAKNCIHISFLNKL